MYWSVCHVTARRVLQPALYGIRPLHVKGHPEYTEESEDQKPLKFSTSKGGHRQWTVEQSLGSDYGRPWWKVLPVSALLTGVLLWAYLREETEIDEILYRPVSDLLGDIDESNKSDQNK